MSLLPPQAIDEFQILWKQHYGTGLPRDEAVWRAQQIFTLMELLVRDQSRNGSGTRDVISDAAPPTIS